MNFSKFAQEIYIYLLVPSLHFIQEVMIKRFSIIHSFQAGSHALMNDFKSSSYGENITKS